jgi:hypothetical protein
MHSLSLRRLSQPCAARRASQWSNACNRIVFRSETEHVRKSRVERARETGGEVAAKAFIEVIATAKRLRRANPRTGERRSFRQIARELQSMGHLNERGYPYKAASIKAMVDRPTPAGVQE